MPTNILRKHSRSLATSPVAKSRTATPPREIFIHAGKVVIRARLRATPTADRIWATLPIYSTAETWGHAIQFETHAETGRESDAKSLAAPGDIAYWVESDRVIIPFGRTPISTASEIRLPCRCNVWAQALDDVTALATVRPGQRIAILEAAS